MHNRRCMPNGSKKLFMLSRLLKNNQQVTLFEFKSKTAEKILCSIKLFLKNQIEFYKLSLTLIYLIHISSRPTIIYNFALTYFLAQRWRTPSRKQTDSKTHKIYFDQNQRWTDCNLKHKAQLLQLAQLRMYAI